MALPHSEISAKVHFSTGFAVVLAAAVLSYFAHETAFGRHMEMANLDAWFGLAATARDPDIAVVGIGQEDYNGPVFHRSCPLGPEGLRKLIRAVGQSRAAVIVVDLDTSEWKADERRAVEADLAAIPRAGGAAPPQVAWAIGGGQDTSGRLTLESLTDSSGCLGVPASIPDDYGVVRGYLPYVPSGGAQVPSLAEIAVHMAAGKGCGERAKATSSELPPVDLIEYSGGPGHFVHLAAGVVLSAADTAAWQNANPLQGKIVLIGGQFQEARDRYVTPAGYLDGVDILAHAVASSKKGGIPEPSHRTFVLADLAIGFALVTLSFFVRGFRMLAISFVAIPFVALAASYALYSYTGYFLSFMPILAAVFLHHLVEHGVEHWKLTREHGLLKKEVQELRARLHHESEAP